MAPNLPPLPGSAQSRSTVPPGPQVVPETLERIAKCQRQLLWGILILMLLSCVAFSVPWVYLFIIIAQGILLYRLGAALELRPILFWVIGAAIPYVGLLVLLIINQKATRLLTAAGFKVGLMGASLPKRSSNV